MPLPVWVREMPYTNLSRRAVLSGAAALSPTFAVAENIPEWRRALEAMPGFRPWRRPQRSGERLLEASVRTIAGPQTVRTWLGGRPAVVVTWASWCPPCLAEKRTQSAVSLWLERSGLRTQIKALHAFENLSLERARLKLDQLGAQALETSDATVRAEQALLYIFGFERDRRSANRASNMIQELSTALPFSLMYAADGTLIGEMVGAVSLEDGRSYWMSPEAQALLRALDQTPSP